MIYLWLILLAAAYVVAAIVVGKVCAINSRWEKTVDGIEPGGSATSSRNGFLPPMSDRPPRLAGVGHVKPLPFDAAPEEEE